MRGPADLPDGCASKSSPLPPAAAFLGALRLVQLPFQPRHQVFGGLQPRLLFAQADLSLSDTLLCGLMFPAAVIRLLLHGATVGHFSLQRSLVRGGPAPQLGRLGLGAASWSRSASFAARAAASSPDRRSITVCSGATAAATASPSVTASAAGAGGLPSRTRLLRAGGKHFGRDTDFRLQRVVSGPAGPFPASGAGRCGAGAA